MPLQGFVPPGTPWDDENLGCSHPQPLALPWLFPQPQQSESHPTKEKIFIFFKEKKKRGKAETNQINKGANAALDSRGLCRGKKLSQSGVSSAAQKPKQSAPLCRASCSRAGARAGEQWPWGQWGLFRLLGGNSPGRDLQLSPALSCQTSSRFGVPSRRACAQWDSHRMLEVAVNASYRFLCR